MLDQYKSPPKFVLSLITLALACALITLAACTPATTPEVTPTGLPVPGPTLQVLDFRTFLPAVPPGFGKLADHLLFFSDRSGSYELYQIALDGSGLVQLTQNSSYDMEPAWSKDGKIAFTSTHVNGQWEVFVVHPDGPRATQLADFGAGNQVQLTCLALDRLTRSEDLQYISCG